MQQALHHQNRATVGLETNGVGVRPKCLLHGNEERGLPAIATINTLITPGQRGLSALATINPVTTPRLLFKPDHDEREAGKTFCRHHEKSHAVGYATLGENLQTRSLCLLDRYVSGNCVAGGKRTSHQSHKNWNQLIAW